MFFVSEEYLRRFQETGDVGASTLGKVAPLGGRGRGRGRGVFLIIGGGGSLVRRRQDLGLHELHGLAAALGSAVPGLDAEDFGAPVLALESLAQLVGHVRTSGSYCFCCMGWSQQLISPSPPFVTILSLPPLPHF